MNNIQKLLHQIESEYILEKANQQRAVERNNELFKVLATVKNDLEKTLKKPETLKDTVYSCIDLLRSNTPYYSTNEGCNKIDPPLTDEQKTL
jgi:hypothetical protein